MEKETLYRFFRGETTPDEQQCLMDWLDADEEHRRTFDRERQMYNALLLFAPQKQVAFRQSIGLRRIIGYAAQIAAMLALAVGIGWGLFPITSIPGKRLQLVSLPLKGNVSI